MAMTCPLCGTEIKDGENACPFCGSAVENSPTQEKITAPAEVEISPESATEKAVPEAAVVPVVEAVPQGPVAIKEETVPKFVCNRCGKEYPAGTKFCVECGGKVEEVKPAEPEVFACVGCGKEYPAGTKFCVECGGKIEKVKPAAPVVFACIGCGKEYPAGTKFCAECGGKVKEVKPAEPEVFACVGCGKEYPAGTKFCAECGGKIEVKNARSSQWQNDYKAGEESEMRGKYRDAIVQYEKANTYKAWCRIGHIYQKGLGRIPVNMKEALSAYRKAAAMEDESEKDGFAECYLGFFHNSGNCVPRNQKEAVKWFRISASYGNAYAEKELNRLGY